MSVNLARTEESKGRQEGLPDITASPVGGDAGQRPNDASTGGVGIMFGTDPLSEGFHVTRLFEGSPAEKDGRIQLGDSLIYVDSRPVLQNMTLKQLTSLVRGAIGSHVSLAFIRRPIDSDPIQFTATLVRDNAFIQSMQVTSQQQQQQQARVPADIVSLRQAIDSDLARQASIQDHVRLREQQTAQDEEEAHRAAQASLARAAALRAEQEEYERRSASHSNVNGSETVLESKEVPMPPVSVQETAERSSEQVGLGVLLCRDEKGDVWIDEISPEGSAARDGRLCKGDRLVAINGQSTATLADLSSVIVGAPGTWMDVTYIRGHLAPDTIALRRGLASVHPHTPASAPQHAALVTESLPASRSSNGLVDFAVVTPAAAPKWSPTYEYTDPVTGLGPHQPLPLTGPAHLASTSAYVGAGTIAGAVPHHYGVPSLGHQSLGHPASLRGSVATAAETGPMLDPMPFPHQHFNGQTIVVAGQSTVMERSSQDGAPQLVAMPFPAVSQSQSGTARSSVVAVAQDAPAPLTGTPGRVIRRWDMRLGEWVQVIDSNDSTSPARLAPIEPMPTTNEDIQTSVVIQGDFSTAEGTDVQTMDPQSSFEHDPAPPLSNVGDEEPLEAVLDESLQFERYEPNISDGSDKLSQDAGKSHQP